MDASGSKKACENYTPAGAPKGGDRRITWIREDEEIDPHVGVRKARKLIEANEVDHLTGIVSFQGTQPAQYPVNSSVRMSSSSTPALFRMARNPVTIPPGPVM